MVFVSLVGILCDELGAELVGWLIWYRGDWCGRCREALDYVVIGSGGCNFVDDWERRR